MSRVTPISKLNKGPEQHKSSSGPMKTPTAWAVIVFFVLGVTLCSGFLLGYDTALLITT